MIAVFQKHLSSLVPKAKQESFLLAVSGGVDSMLMAELFIASKYKVGLAHCNFGLRSKESDADEAFVEAFAKKHKVPFYTKRFDTKKYAEKKKLSVQMAARELRYTWLSEVREKHKYSYLAIAHNSDDAIETFFINLLRGTGIAGLHGITGLHNHIVRPMLGFSRPEIEDYANEVLLKWREDSSNASDKYERNKIRHHLLPLLEKLNPKARKAIHHTIENLRGAEHIYMQQVNKALQGMVRVNRGKTYISVPALKKLELPEIYIYETIKAQGFNFMQAREIAAALDKQPGKAFYAHSHRITLDRNYLVMEVTPLHLQEEYKVDKDTKVLSVGPFDMDFSTDDIPRGFKPPGSALTACLDYERLKFPLTIRKWQKGDRFYPLGMDRPKKLSDFLIDAKVPLADKDDVYVLLSQNDLVWVIGYRIDNRFKVASGTKKLYICNIELIPSL